jgi:hypothetical protein
MAYEIVEFEKLIESQYITRSIQGRADELVIQAKGITEILSQVNFQTFLCNYMA